MDLENIAREMSEYIDMPEEVCDKPATGNSKISAFIKDLGGDAFIISSSELILNNASRFKKENKKYQTGITFLKTAIPLFITAYRAFGALNNIRSEVTESKHDRFIRQVRELLKIDDIDSLDWNHVTIGSTVCFWLLSLPESNNLKILEIYDDQLKPLPEVILDDSMSFKSRTYILHLIVEEMEAIISISIACGAATRTIIYHNRQHRTAAIDLGLLKSFTESLNYKENIIKYGKWGLETSPRPTVDFNVYQLDSKFKTELRKVIDKRKTRGYAFIGVPGVGKSTILYKLYEEFTDIPIIQATFDSDAMPSNIAMAFAFSRIISPSILIFEDLDIFDLTYKRSRQLSCFIEQLDSMKHRTGTIVIATMNEPQTIHESLIERRGRFDKILHITSPQSNEHVIEIIENRFKQETGRSIKVDINDEILQQIIGMQLKHSDICELVDHVLINDLELNSESINDGINYIKEAREVIQLFKNKDKVANNGPTGAQG